MASEITLTIWSSAGLLWWIISWQLVAGAAKATKPLIQASRIRSLTVFKPLSPLENEGLHLEARGLESFISQLDAESELLLGVHEADWPEVRPFIEQMQAAYPKARINVVRRSELDTLANPKIAWQKLLAPHATGELWLWSDADIVVPPGFLARARAEFETCGAELLTFPYAVRSVQRLPDLLDALFVNAEFYPGVLLLRCLGPVDFGLGSAMLFTRESFLRKVTWEKLGSSLADDFVLGQALKPVRLSGMTLETVAHAETWTAAFAHYFRWKKTVCWCRPAGFAAQVITMPVLGWLGFLLWNPLNIWAWVGLIAMIQIDVLFAAIICRSTGCHLNAAALLATESWSVWRVLFWMFCWVPGPIKWRQKTWRRAQEPAPVFFRLT